METNIAVIVFVIRKKQFITDLEVPLHISVRSLLTALDKIFDLGVDFTDMRKCYLTSERPLAMLRGEMSLYEAGIMNGSIVCYNF